jgi:hypothetical protein
MPTYVYQVINEDGSEGETFEVIQKMTDPPLEKHPETGKPVRRVLQPPRIAGRWTESASKKALSDRNLDRLGFTKYQKTGKGVYEKRAGSGPPTIDAG